MLQLRPYQDEAVHAVYEHLQRREDQPCVVLPTGSGKSLVIAQICSDAVSRWGGRVLILAHVKELLQQNADKLHRLAPDINFGIYSAGLKSRRTKEPVIVAGIQSVYQKACELGAFDLILIDEAQPPTTVDEALYYAKTGCFAIPKRLMVIKTSGQRFEEVIEHDFTEKPELLEMADSSRRKRKKPTECLQ